MFNNLSDEVTEFVIEVPVFDEILPLVVLTYLGGIDRLPHGIMHKTAFADRHSLMEVSDGMTLHVERIVPGFVDPEERRWNINPFDPQRPERGATAKRRASFPIAENGDAIGRRLVEGDFEKTLYWTNSLKLGLVPVYGTVDSCELGKSQVHVE